jgi:hypothetical protein
MSDLLRNIDERTELASGNLVMMLDVEKVLAETGHFNDDIALKSVKPM